MSYYKKVTLKDIANDSGVSVSSVSMILNKREGVSFSNETVEKVLSFCPLRKNWDMRFLLPKKRMVHPLTILKDPQNILLFFALTYQTLITLQSHNPLSRLLIKKDLKL